MVTIFAVIFLILTASACLMCRFMDNKDKNKGRGKDGRSRQSGSKSGGKYYKDYEDERDVDYRIAEGYSRETSEKGSSEDFRRE